MGERITLKQSKAMLRIELIGNLGADAEVKVSNGDKFVAFRVANTDRWTDDDGTKHDETQWIDCTMNNADSKIIPYLKAGQRVFVRGRARFRVYSSPKQRKMLPGVTVKVQEIELLGGQTDAVPRRIVDPETSELVDVTKYYWCPADTKKMKKDELRLMLDERGNQYQMNKQGFVAPVQPAPQAESAPASDGNADTEA